MLASLVRELIGMGLGDAKQVLLTGTSAGGVAAMLQADRPNRKAHDVGQLSRVVGHGMIWPHACLQYDW